MARGEGKSRGRRVEVEATKEPDDDFPRDLVNDPMWLRDLLHRTYAALPRTIPFKRSFDPKDAKELVRDVEFIFSTERARDYEIPSDEDEAGPDEDEEDDDEEDDDEEGEDEEEDEEDDEEEDDETDEAPRARRRSRS